MASMIRQEYDIGDGAKLTLSIEADRPISADELALLSRIAGMIEGKTKRDR